jgi:hypothetical protein
LTAIDCGCASRFTFMNGGSGDNNKQFGILIAYVLPGFIVLAGLTPQFPAVARWLQPVPSGDLGVGPPLYAVLGATALGLVLSCFRWVLIDSIHHGSGIRRPVWNDGQLDQVLAGFDYVVQNHFRYYEFSANSLLALVFAYGLNRFSGTLPFLGPGTDLGMLILVAVLFAASRDALAKYYTRTARLVGQVAEKAARGDPMYNGNDHGGGGGSDAKPPSDTATPRPHAPATPAKPGQSKPNDRPGNR